MFKFLRKKPNNEMKGYIETLTDLSNKELECNILYRALQESCDELFRYTGNIKECNPGFFIDKIKSKFYQGF